jgi:hypothetical protein
MPPDGESFQKNGGAPLIEQTLNLLAQPAQNARLGDEDGVDGQAQLGRHLFGRGFVEHDAAERPPGDGPKLRLDVIEHFVRDMAIVLAVPLPAQRAGRRVRDQGNDADWQRLVRLYTPLIRTWLSVEERASSKWLMSSQNPDFSWVGNGCGS